MANLVKHRFVSGKADGPDATQVQPSAWNDGHVFAGGNAGDLLTRDPTDATYGAAWATLGTFVDIPYAPTNFGADAGATWTPAAGDILTYGYARIGKVLLVSFFSVGGTITGAPHTLTIYGLPAPSTRTIDVPLYAVTAVDVPVATLRATAGQSYLQLLRSDGGAWPAGGSGFRGQIAVPTA